MALDVLVLGGFVFDAWATPETLPLGGKHQFHVHKLPGGDRVVDAMGPDDRNRDFAGIHKGEFALEDALTLDAMRIAGEVLPYSNGAEARLVIIDSFDYEVEKYQVIHFKISLLPVDNPAGTAGIATPLDGLLLSDLDAAITVASLNLGLT